MIYTCGIVQQIFLNRVFTGKSFRNSKFYVLRCQSIQKIYVKIFIKTLKTFCFRISKIYNKIKKKKKNENIVMINKCVCRFFSPKLDQNNELIVLVIKIKPPVYLYFFYSNSRQFVGIRVVSCGVGFNDGEWNRIPLNIL